MGYETFLVEVRIPNAVKDIFVKDLVKNKFSFTEKSQTIYLEKMYKSGIIEVCVSRHRVTFRYAKPNLKESLLEFLKELQSLSYKYSIVLYNFYDKKEYLPKQFLELADSFEICHNEFVELFPVDMIPIKSDDVLIKQKK